MLMAKEDRPGLFSPGALPIGGAAGNRTAFLYVTRSKTGGVWMPSTHGCVVCCAKKHACQVSRESRACAVRYGGSSSSSGSS
jgi:hypothetical protein